MSGKRDEVKGRIKEAAGALTGNEELKREGQRDQAVGKVRQAVDAAVEGLKDTAEAVTRKTRQAAKKIKDS